MAEIYDTETDDMITGGLNGSRKSDEAIQLARRIAAERGETVLLVDDGEWLVEPDGECSPAPSIPNDEEDEAHEDDEEAGAGDHAYNRYPSPYFRYPSPYFRSKS